MLIRIFSCIFFALGLQYLYAQNEPYRFTTFGTRDGLPEKFVYNATQDASGFIWLGTANGIYRYDGVQFEKFNNKEGFPFGLVQALYIPSEQEIWLGGVQLFSAYNPSLRKTVPLPFPQKEVEILRQSDIHFYFKDSSNKLWIGTRKSFCWNADKEARTLTLAKRTNTLLGDAHQSVVRMQEGMGKLWLLTHWGVFSRPVKSPMHQEWQLEFEETNAYFTDLVLDTKRNCIWLSSQSQGIAKWSMQNKSLRWLRVKASTSVGLESLTSITAMTWKSENELWFSYGQLGYFNVDDEKAKLLSEQDRGSFAYRTQKVSNFFTDREKNLWICSYNGLSVMYWQNQQVQSIPLFDSVLNYIVEPKVVAESEDGHYLYVANTVANGLIQMDNGNRKIRFMPTPYNKPVIAVGVFPGNQVIGSDGENLLAFDGFSGKKLPWKDQYHMPVKGIKKIIDGKGGKKILLVGEGNWYEYLPGQNQLYKNISNNLSINQAKAIPWIPFYVDTNNNVWLKASGYLYFKSANQKKDVFLDGKTYPTVDMSQIGGMEQDNEGNYWLATKTNGLYRLVPTQNGKFNVTHFNTESLFRMPSDGCTRICKDSKGMLWVGSLSGLFCLDPKRLWISSILREQQGLTYDYIDVEMSITPQGKLVVSNYGVLNIIDINNFKTNTLVPKPSLGSLKTMGRFLNPVDFSMKNRFGFQENYFEFHIVPGVLNNSSEYNYAYKLEGADKDWVTGGTRSYVSYAGLSDGNYRFVAKVCNNDGQWSDPVSLYSFTITPPFWKTWWFLTTAIALILLLMWWRYRVKLTSVHAIAMKEAEFQKKVSALELKALRAQMNPHFVFNALNSIQKFILEKDHLTAAQYLTKFSRLIRLILEQSDQHLIGLDKELELLQHYLEIEAMRFDKKFEWKINVAPDIAIGNTILPTLLVQPFIENAIWHGLLHKDGPRKLLIDFKLSEPYLHVFIEDNGIGLKAATELKSKASLKNKSLGMQITKDRMAVIDVLLGIQTKLSLVDLTDPTGAVIGTRVEIVIPSNLNQHVKSYTGR